MPPKSTVSHQSDGKTELETHHSETIFCDMISPDEWKSSLPLVFQQDDVCLLSNSPTSPSNSIEDLVLELENSQQDIGNPFSEYPGKHIFSIIMILFVLIICLTYFSDLKIIFCTKCLLLKLMMVP